MINPIQKKKIQCRGSLFLELWLILPLLLFQASAFFYFSTAAKARVDEVQDLQKKLHLAHRKAQDQTATKAYRCQLEEQLPKVLNPKRSTKHLLQNQFFKKEKIFFNFKSSVLGIGAQDDLEHFECKP